MNCHRIVLLVYLIAITAAQSVYAQTQDASTDGTVRVTLVEGTSVVGVVVSENDDEIVLRTSSDILMTIPRDRIKTVVSVDKERFALSDPNRTRLLFAPTGRSVGAGAGYVAIYEVFIPFAAVGAGRAVTLAGGITVNPGNSRIAYAAPKITLLETSTTSLAVGAVGMAVLGDLDGYTAGLLYGVGTFGRADASLTIGLAFGYAEGDVGKKPVLMLGGEYQVSNRVKLLTENYLFTGAGEDGLLVSGGFRVFAERLAADFGLITMPSLIDESGGFPAIPWVGFAYNFGR